MKFLKYLFFSLLPIMLLMMLFGYNNSSFLGAKAGASSITNTINFYGKDNYLIGSYEVPNGQSINDQTRNTTEDYSSSIFTPASRSAVSSTSDAIVFNSDYSRFSINGSSSSYDNGILMYKNGKLNGTFTTYSGVILDNIPENLSVDVLRFNILLAKTTTYSTFNYFDLYLYNFDTNYNLVSSYPLTYYSSDTENTFVISQSLSINTSGYYYLCARCNYTLSGNAIITSRFSFSIDVTYSNISGVIDNSYSLADIINSDIQTASNNGYIDLMPNYSWSTQSNFNNGFTFDTDIYYDLDLYYLQENRVFNFANGWQTTLGEMSNLTFFTETALKELIKDFNTFNTLDFNGDFLTVLKAIGLAIANIFNVIISLAYVLVAPILDLVAIIVLMVVKSSSFWTFT